MPNEQAEEADAAPDDPPSERSTPRPERPAATTDRSPESNGHFDLDDDELVGPGKYPLRIQPAAAIQPGERDARRLLRMWFVRKSFYWMFFLGWMIANIIATVRHQDAQFELSADVSPIFFLVLLALAIRFVVGWVALGLAIPLALAHEPNLSPRDNFGSSIGLFFDRLHVARAFRALRWTHHVRQVAQHRLGEKGRRLGRLDPIFDIINITSGVLALLSVIVLVAVGG